MKLLAALVALALVASACSGGEGSPQSTAITTATTTAIPGVPTTVVPTTVGSTPTVVPSTLTTAPSPGAPAAEVVASVEAEFQEEWNYYLRYLPPGPPSDSEKYSVMPRGVVGPVDITCDVQGEVGFGDVMECEAAPLEEREYYPDPLPMVILVTGDDGSAAWARYDLETRYQTVGSGLYCRDLIDEEIYASNYFGAVGYWFRDGRPDRMDADKDGIPCETVYSLASISDFWWGTPLEAVIDIHFGYITDLTPTGPPYELTIDYAIMLGGMEANLAAEAAGDIQPGEGVPNDFFIVNENPWLRTFELASDVEVSLMTSTGDIVSIPVDPDLWVVLVEAAGRCSAVDGSSDCFDLGGEDWHWFGSGTLPYWIQLEAGSIVRVEEQYLP